MLPHCDNPRSDTLCHRKARRRVLLRSLATSQRFVFYTASIHATAGSYTQSHTYRSIYMYRKQRYVDVVRAFWLFLHSVYPPSTQHELYTLMWNPRVSWRSSKPHALGDLEQFPTLSITSFFPCFSQSATRFRPSSALVHGVVTDADVITVMDQTFREIMTPRHMISAPPNPFLFHDISCQKLWFASYSTIDHPTFEYQSVIPPNQEVSKIGTKLSEKKPLMFFLVKNDKWKLNRFLASR